MAFLRRSCKNVRGGTDQITMKAMMWRYRDAADRAKSHLSIDPRKPRNPFQATQ
jgi:hypothetical protein